MPLQKLSLVLFVVLFQFALPSLSQTGIWKRRCLCLNSSTGYCWGITRTKTIWNGFTRVDVIQISPLSKSKIQNHSDTVAEAAAYFAAMPGPLEVTTLLLYDFRQAVRFQIRLHRDDPSKGYPRAEGTKMLVDLKSDLVRDEADYHPGSLAQDSRRCRVPQ
jgi:hypothetical protein